MKKFWANKSSKATKAAIASLAVGALSIGTVATNAMLASQPKSGITTTIDTLFGVASEGLQSIYGGLLGVVTILAIAICAWCFCVKMFSKNPRSIDEANQWIKRVAIAWLCFMLLSVFVAIGVDIVKSSGASTSEPW